MTRCSDDMYDQKFCISETPVKTPVASARLRNIYKQTNEKPSSHVPYKSRDSSTGGKLHPYGPRRVIKPLFQGDYETNKSKICVSTAQLKNYQAIFAIWPVPNTTGKFLCSCPFVTIHN